MFLHTYVKKAESGLGSGSGTINPDPERNWINVSDPDTDPDPQHCINIEIKEQAMGVSVRAGRSIPTNPIFFCQSTS
jgi:hypothetical protein